jgi:hypothetical protein
LGLGFNQARVNPATLESNKEFQKTVAQFAYKEKGANLDQDLMMDEYEDDTLFDNDGEDPFIRTTTTTRNFMPTATKKTRKEVVMIDQSDEEAETEVEEEHTETEEEADADIEETIVVRTPQSSQRSRISYAREASHSGKRINEKFIIFGCSDDEDYVVDSDME